MSAAHHLETETSSDGLPPKQLRLIERSADVALSAAPVPLRVLDVCSGSGALLREVVIRLPYGEAYVGIDPSPWAAAGAREDSDRRITFLCAEPDALPFPDAYFDLVVSCGAFEDWPDQAGGVDELARVVADTGTVVLVTRSAPWMRSGGRVTRPKHIIELLEGAGLRLIRRESVHRKGRLLPHVQAFIASP